MILVILSPIVWLLLFLFGDRPHAHHVHRWWEVERKSFQNPASRDPRVETLVRYRCATCTTVWILSSPYEEGSLAAAQERMGTAWRALGGTILDRLQRRP